jgi:hypothetical protein
MQVLRLRLAQNAPNFAQDDTFISCTSLEIRRLWFDPPARGVFGAVDSVQ